MLPKTALASDEEYIVYLRDWFAGQAIIGFLTVNAPSKLDDPSPALAWAAYHMADAMLAERAKAGQP